MKLHLPLSLRSALLACLAFCPQVYASTYVATGSDIDDITASCRFYDSGQGVYWLEAGAQPFIGAGVLHAQTGSTEFMGNLNNYIPEGTDTSQVHSGLFAGLTDDSKTSWYHATANVIQYWQSYYGVFAQNATTMPYGYTYDPANQQLLGGTQSLNVGMYFYDNWTNNGGDFAMAARWYLTNDHTYTNSDKDTLSKLKVPGTEAGYFTPYFKSGADSVVVQDAYTQESLDAAIVNAFGLSAVEGKENTYAQSKPGQIAFIGISCEEASTALTCYGFKTDEKGNVTSLLLAASDDAAYQITEVYVKEVEVTSGDGVHSVRLYKDAACTELWERGGKGDWYLDAVSYINTPDVLVKMYDDYSKSDLTWTGNSTIWKQETGDKSLYTLPDSSSGWTAHAGTDTEFAGEYATYYTEGRKVVFTSKGAGIVELVGDIEPSRVTVNNEKGADYVFTGEGKLTGTTSLTKQGEGTLSISTVNDYSGGTRLEGGELLIRDTYALGTGKIELVQGTLNLDGNTIGNYIAVTEGADVILRNGLVTGGFSIESAGRYTADNVRFSSDAIRVQGNGVDSVVHFENLFVDDGGPEYVYGGYLGAESVSISGVDELSFSSATVSKHALNAHVFGGLVYGDQTIDICSNNRVEMKENSINSPYYSMIFGGLLAGRYVTFADNKAICISDNVIALEDSSGVAHGGVMRGLYLTLQGNDVVALDNNRVTHVSSWSGEFQGGVLWAEGGMQIMGNDTVSICNNQMESVGGEAGWVYGGAIYMCCYETPVISGNSTVTMTGNSVASDVDALGGAIYCTSANMEISNNQSVTFRGNYERTGDSVRLRSIYACRSLELTAETGQQISIYDSIYAGEELELNKWGASGEVLLSGAHTETDIFAVKKTSGTEAEISNSRTSIVEGSTTLGGGLLRIEGGAILQTRGLQTVNWSDARVHLNHGTIRSVDYTVSFGRNTDLHVQGCNNIISAGLLEMQGGSSMSFTLDSTNKEQAVLTLLSPMQLQGRVTLNIDFTTEERENYYILMDVGMNGGAPENWYWMEVNGYDQSQLVWQDGYLYLNYSGDAIPAISPYFWYEGENATWDHSSFNWWHDGEATAFRDYAMVEFRDEGAGTVELSGNITARSVLVNSSADYAFTGRGKLTGAMCLTKQGEGTLTLATINDFSGGIQLRGGSLAIEHEAALGTGVLELENGVLELNGHTIENNISIPENAEVVVRNGMSTGSFAIDAVKSFTADNFRVQTSDFTIEGDGCSSVVNFANLTVETTTKDGGFYGGYIKADTVNITGMSELNMMDAEVVMNGGPLGGGLISGAVLMEQNGSISFRNNTVYCRESNFDGGLICGNYELDFVDNDSIDFSGNTISGTYIYGGLMASANIRFTDNEKLTITANNIWTDGANGGCVNADIYEVKGSAEIVVENNLVKVTSAMGGVIMVHVGATFEDNESIIVRNNLVEASGISVKGAFLHQFYSGEYSVFDTSFRNNGDIEMSWNAAIAREEALGGAIYGAGGVQFLNNRSVLLRGNYEQQGDEVRLRSIYTKDSLELSAGEGQRIEVYDSVYADGNLRLNAEGEAGTIRLSGIYTEADLRAVKGIAPSHKEIVNSQTNIIKGQAILGGGTLSIEYGAVLNTGGFGTTSGSGAVVEMNHGVIMAGGNEITLGTGTTLTLSGVGNCIWADTIVIQDGCNLSFNLDAENAELPVLSSIGEWIIEGNINLNLTYDSKAGVDVYMLMSVGVDDSPVPGNWEPSALTINGADYSQLVWQDGYLYLNCSGTEIPHVQPFVWKGTEGSMWDSSTLNWWQDGIATSCKSYSSLEFLGEGAGNVELVETMMVRSILVDSEQYYHFIGEGNLTGGMSLVKRGTGLLSISTSNNYFGVTRLENGSLYVGNEKALGSSELELIKGSLDLGGHTIRNSVRVQEGAEIVVRNGVSTGRFISENALSFTADNYRILMDGILEVVNGDAPKSDIISITGNPDYSIACFVNLNINDTESFIYRGGYLGASNVHINGMKNLSFANSMIVTRATHFYGGLVHGYDTVIIENNAHVTMDNNTIRHLSSFADGGLINGSSVWIEGNGDMEMSGNKVYSLTYLSGGLLYGGDINIVGNDSVRMSMNESSAIAVSGGLIEGWNINIEGNARLEIYGNVSNIVSPNGCSGPDVSGGVLSSNYSAVIRNNGSIVVSENRTESQIGSVYGGVMSATYMGGKSDIWLSGNDVIEMTNNAAISLHESLGAAIYSVDGVNMSNNDHVLLRGNVEQQGNDYRLRSIYACGNLEMSAGAGQNIQVYDSVYTGGNLVLNANGAGGEILLSGAHTEADLRAVKGSAGSTQEITNSRTNTVVGTTTLGGGVLRMEAGAILQTRGFSAAADSDAQMWLDNAVLNSSGYEVSFGSGAGLVAGGSNTLTASNFTMQEGSYLSFDLRDKNLNHAALSVNASMSLNGLDVVVMNADIMTAGKYKLLTLADAAQYDTAGWAQSINSVTGVDAASLSWEKGTLYYTSTNEWIVSVTETATIVEDTEGEDIVIGNGGTLLLDACRQGHKDCDNPKHGGRPGNPGLGHAKPNNGNGNGNGNGNHKGGDGSIVIVEGSAYIKDRGEFEGLLSFRGSADEERHFYTEKDLGVAYIAVFTDDDATSHLHIVEGKKVETEGIVGNGKLKKNGAGRLELDGHDADESSTLYFGCLGVEEGAVRVADNSQAYIATTAVTGTDTAAAMEVGIGATMTGESLVLEGSNSTLENNGSIVMTDGVQVNGGTVKGSGSFNGLTMNSGTLVIGNSPGVQTYTRDLVLGKGDAIFSVGGFESVATESQVGWAEQVYSTVDMQGNAFTLSEDVVITLAFGGEALVALAESTTAEPLTFSLTLAQDIGNVAYFTDEMLAGLEGQTQFIITTEMEGLNGLNMELAGLSLNDYVSQVSYALNGNNLVLTGTVATNGALSIPEPTTATLSLLALAALAARRRRKS